MEKTLLKDIYVPENFRELGHQLVDLLAKHLETTINGQNTKTIQWNLPENELVFWKEFLVTGKKTSFFEEILKRTTHTHNPKYVGHQVAPPAPITALTAMIGSMLNNGMAVYEMGMSPTGIERTVTDLLAKK